jgi:hypothetical protein
MGQTLCTESAFERLSNGRGTNMSAWSLLTRDK